MKISQAYLELGAKIETESQTAFAAFLKKSGLKFQRDATPQEDMHKHIDCYIKDASGKIFSVDIKGLKHSISTGRVLVELQNVQGNRGWLFGQADFIAFQVSPSDFLMVRRNDLFKLVRESCKMEVICKGTFNVAVSGMRVSDVAACNAPNWYGREERKDKVTFVSLEKVQKLALTF